MCIRDRVSTQSTGVAAAGMFSAIRRAGKEQLKVQYDLRVTHLTIPLPDNTLVRIRWKRGSSTENRTMDRRVLGNKVSFMDAMTIICTLWYDSEDNSFLEKESTIQVLEIESSTGNPIKHASITFPLEHHACYGHEVECKPLEFALGSGGNLQIEISSRSLDKAGQDSEEFSGSDRSSLNEYPFDWDEEQDWEKNAHALEELQVLRAELDKERQERGGQLQDLHDEMVSLDEELKQCQKNEVKAQRALAEADSRCIKLQTENTILREEVESVAQGSRGQEDLLQQIGLLI
eukprot:TRINITY_DN25008_c0_g1_i4.p1 TRINITY_DN25008_c0_g1~~TRINITY_DN25008_c0_g1_i4.p1  ORF type:complete len:290 (+),score=58.97 TRINITY_DN25008_c0_g1_i4:132-1001(+)